MGRSLNEVRTKLERNRAALQSAQDEVSRLDTIVSGQAVRESALVEELRQLVAREAAELCSSDGPEDMEDDEDDLLKRLEAVRAQRRPRTSSPADLPAGADAGQAGAASQAASGNCQFFRYAGEDEAGRRARTPSPDRCRKPFGAST